MATVPAAYPFIEITIDTSALAPVAQRSPHVVAVVGKTPSGAAGGAATPAKPYEVSTLGDAAQLFAQVSGGGTVTPTTLYSSLQIALLQDPGPSKIYGVRVDGDDYESALASLTAVDDVDFVSLANEHTVGAAAAGSTPPTDLMALKDHVESATSQGNKRIGVAMVDPGMPKTLTYAADVDTAVQTLKSDVSRMIVVVARGATGDVATASMAAIAGYDPQVSMVLKRVAGLSTPIELAFTPTEIKQLSEDGIIPLIRPSLIAGDALRFAEGRFYTTDAELLYIDIVRVLDDIDFRLRAGLIGTIGDARITTYGLRSVAMRIDSILGPLKASAVIDDYSYTIPVLNILNVPQSTWSPGDTAVVQNARANRTVDVLISVTYGPAVHNLRVTLAPKF